MTTPQVPAPADAFPFWYGGDFAIALANGNSQLSLQIQNHDFRATFLSAQSAGVFKIAILINGRAVQNVQTFGANTVGVGVRGENFFGTAQSPMPLPAPLVFPKGATVQITITDVSGNPNNAGQITFIGSEFN